MSGGVLLAGERLSPLAGEIAEPGAKRLAELREGSTAAIAIHPTPVRGRKSGGG
jgi:hypothetical protein